MSKSKPLTADDVRRAIGKVFQGQLSDSLVDQVVESLGLTPVSFMEELQVLDDALQPGTNRIDAIRKRRAAVAANGWHVFDRKSNPPGVSRVMERGANLHIAEVSRHADAEFIANCPDDIDYLLAENKRLKEHCRFLSREGDKTFEEKEHLLAEVERLQAALSEVGATAQDTDDKRLRRAVLNAVSRGLWPDPMQDLADATANAGEAARLYDELNAIDLSLDTAELSDEEKAKRLAELAGAWAEDEPVELFACDDAVWKEHADKVMSEYAVELDLLKDDEGADT